jgi:hypothetical protein
MHTRRPLLALALLLLLPGTARAHKHDFRASVAGSVSPSSTLWGFHASGEWVIPTEYKDFSVALDLSYHSGLHEGANLTRLALTPALRWTPRLGRHGEAGAVHPFMHVLFGPVRTNDATNRADWSAALGAGAGVDLLFSDYGGVWVQTDFLKPLSGGKDSFVRVSVGLAYRFDKSRKQP